MATAEELLAELLDVARDQLRWQRAAALPGVRETVDQTLTRTQLRKAYELCDGSRTRTTVAAEVGTTQQSVSNWTRLWCDLGIAYEADGGRVRHITSLKWLGLPVDVPEAAGRRS